MILKELANRLKLCPVTIQNKIRAGLLPRRYKYLNLNGRVRRYLWFEEVDLTNYLKRFNDL